MLVRTLSPTVMSEIDSESLAERLPDDELYLLESRHEDEFDDWHIPDSETIDVYDELKDDPNGAKEQLSEIPEDEEVTTVSAAGEITQRATETLRDFGYGAELVGVFDTHVHADYVSGGRDLAQRHDVSYYLHPADTLDVKAQPAEDKSVHMKGVGGVCVIHPPSHSPGAVTYSIKTEALESGSSRCVAE